MNSRNSGFAYGIALAALIMTVFAGAVRAATVDGNLRVEVITAYNLVVDSNAGTPSSYAPQAAYIGATFHNDGTTPITDLIANIGDFAAGTPGIYPSRAHPGLTGPLPGGEFAFRHEGGSSGLADATRFIPEIPAGESITVYWLIGYDQLDESEPPIPLWGSSVKPFDDLWLEYDIWATAVDGASTTRNVDITRTFTFRNEISASPNKILPNGANKVPDYYKELFSQYIPAWTNAYYDGSVGTDITTEGIWYDLGNVGAGFDNDGDLVPDKNAWMQPVGNPAIFDAGSFRLVKTYAYVIVKLKTGGEIVLEGEDQLYFENIPENNGAVGFVQYIFMPLLPNARALTSPYQEVASGFDNEKFNADYGIALGDELVSKDSLVLMDKTVDLAAVYPATDPILTYTVSYTNSSPTVSAGNRDAGLPLVIQDEIPAGTTYAGGASTDNTLPSGYNDYKILFSTDGGVTWTTDESSITASDVTHIQWWLDNDLAPEDAGAITFTVAVDNPFNEPAPIVVNEAGTSFGNTKPFATDDATTFILGDNSLGDTVYGDTGVGGGYIGNTIQDGNEPGLTNITVSLYYDTNTNGVVDAGDLFRGTQVTDSNGEYLFDNLPDGSYVVLVDTRDVDLPNGYTVTTVDRFEVSLAGGQAYEDADFGFAPALALSKTRNFSGTVYEGQEITYKLSVTNSLVGDGTGVASPTKYRVWATSGTTSATAQKAWTDPANAYHTNEPDGQYASAPMAAAGEWLNLASMSIGTQPGDIASVKIVLPLRVTQPFDAGDSLAISVLEGGSDPKKNTLAGTTFTTDVNLLAVGSYEISFDITAARTWLWSHFSSGNTLSIYIEAGGKPSALGIIEVDAAAFEITSTATSGAAGGTTTLDPVPLDDIFDISKLQFVAALPSVDSISTNSGISTLHWNNIGPIYPGGQKDVSVTFKVLEPTGNIADEFTNTASVTQAYFQNGIPANQAEDEVVDTAQPTGVIGDTVWRDVDGNGVQSGAAETGIAGVTVQLYTNGTVLVASAVTDDNGEYLFEGLTDNATYTVTVDETTLPGGSGTCTADKDTTPDSTTSFVLDPAATDGSDTVLDADFGYNNISAIIRGTVWHDVDRGAETAPESGEELFGGVDVSLYSNGVVIATTTTAADGTYEFFVAAPFTYIVEVDDTDLGVGTWIASYDTDDIGTPAVNQVSVAVPAGGEGVADFSYYLTGDLSVGDTLYIDWNGNGTQDAGDIGISGITLLLFQDENTNGVVDIGIDALVGSTVTATNGYYIFDELPAGPYQIEVDRASSGFPSLYTRTADPDGTFDDRSSVVLTANDDLQDFGYQPYGFNSIGDTVWYDANGDQVQSGVTETGIAGATVRLEVDYNDDGNWTQIGTQVTDSNGNYLFANLPDRNYRVTVESSGAGIPDDAFGNDWSPTTGTSFEIEASGGNSYLYADFGFAPLGAIGDTIYWDSNGNADQDWTESGVPNVSVRLYNDNDGDGVVSAGDTIARTLTTDSNGKYLFTGLVAGDYVVDVVDGVSPLINATLTGDPENDGVPCPIPAVPGPSCDGQTGVTILPGTFFMGADFGYQPSGVIGDLVWIDLNTNGVYDAGEQGIPYVTVEVYNGPTLVATNVTDGSGFYNFENLADGTYTVQVVTSDPDFPANLTASYDADGSPDSVASAVVISGGHITEIGGTPVSTGLATDLSIDFGYSYVGDNALSGTIGMDDPASKDGLMNGINPSGPGANEYAFTAVDVNLLLWSDVNSNGIVEVSEYITIATTSTDTNGDYSFSNLPSGSVDDKYIVSMAAPSSDMKLTTTTGDTDATLVVNTTNALGQTGSAYQVVTPVANQENIDFAFETDAAVERDYGDLPTSYGTVIANLPVGPSHEIVPNLYLGSGVDADPDGQPSVDASADTNEDGVVPVGLQWSEGASGGEVEVTVGAGDGWLVGWIDFDQNGIFDPDEMIIDQSVSSTFNGDGVYNFNVDVPSGTFSTTNATVLNARYRLYADQPVVAAAFGPADGGDVEDYQFVRGLAGNFVWEDLDGDGVQDAGEPGVSNVVVNLYASDGTTLIESTTTAEDGSYIFNGLQPADYVITVVGPDGTAFTRQDTPGDEETDSDADATTGSLGTVSLTSDPTRTDADAGLYIPAELFGYLFEDENDDQIRNSGDTTITNALVSLIVDGAVVDSTYTDADGYYEFIDVPAGVVTVQVVQADANLVAVPASSDVMRNRAISNEVDTAVIDYTVLSGYGVLAALPGEPLNFGYDEHPLSTQIDLKVYDAGNGKVMVQISTVNENGNNDIEIYAMIGGQWLLVANVPSEQIVGFGSNTYTVEAIGLTPGESYLFKVVDESGHIFETDTPLTVALAPIQVEGMTLNPELVTVTFNTEYGNFYQIMVTTELGASALWTVEYVSYPTARGYSDLSSEPFMAGPGASTTIRIPRNRDKAFFKIMKVQ